MLLGARIGQGSEVRAAEAWIPQKPEENKIL